jgi:hypothetical protein
MATGRTRGDGILCYVETTLNPLVPVIIALIVALSNAHGSASIPSPSPIVSDLPGGCGPNSGPHCGELPDTWCGGVAGGACGQLPDGPRKPGMGG